MTRVATDNAFITGLLTPIPEHRSNPLIEVIVWNLVAVKPDSDVTVQLFDETASEPVWPGYWDDNSGQWLYIDGVPANPTHWAVFPAGPNSLPTMFEAALRERQEAFGGQEFNAQADLKGGA